MDALYNFINDKNT
ncbi:adenine specific DNA methyltransferase, partial [Helicobacter pylori]